MMPKITEDTNELSNFSGTKLKGDLIIKNDI